MWMGFDGQDPYTTIGGCAFDDRAGREYVTNLKNALTSFTNYYIYTDNYAWKLDMQNLAPNVDFYAFAGHSFVYDGTYAVNGEASSHFYTLNSSTNFHTSENQVDANLTWSEMSIAGSPLKWATFYQCNWLKNGGIQSNYDKIGGIMKGGTLMMSFASTMYLDGREGTTYGTNIQNAQAFKTAFFNAADVWQPQLKPSGATVIARVFGYIPAANDTMQSYYASAPSYSTAGTITL